MITKKNFKELLSLIGFNENNSTYIKVFDEGYTLIVDFKEEKLIYPEDNGFKINGKQTCNFSSNENFVVFECVNRLLEKGYKPKHIELEPRWKLGHGASGGRADILVKDNSDNAFLIIECKTHGEEFNNEWKNTERSGGQLFSYARQATSTKYLCLYSSTIIDGEVNYENRIISLNDNYDYLKSLDKPVGYSDATDVQSLYNAWKSSYNLEYETQGIFEDKISAYKVGKKKYSAHDLKNINSDNIQRKYNEFATILRQHNVSGRENAFDKLVNLFLAKIVDEIENPGELQFYWKGVACDDYYSLQDRIQRLYKEGMEKFLGEEVTYIDNNAISDAFIFFKNDPDATKETILKYFRQLKYFTNNDFAFLDVHNEQLFYQNSVILLKVVKMLQDIKLNTVEPNQFLGDLFEGFLDQGVRQSEGQFFTPTPIVRFIVSSLPIENILFCNSEPPSVIDYACGAGHFLNEYATQIRKYIKNDDLSKYYEQIVGIEKEYRLSKVSKVSAFMYGQDEINIVYGDALSKNINIKNDRFSILIANPPYSVKGFLETLTEDDRKRFQLYKYIDHKTISTNSSIECFFIEKAKQLLVSGGIGAVILPSSVLNNKNAIYTKTREILIKYFDIISIVEFGKGTFGKTGTNTVTLFLRRKKKNPCIAEHYKNRIDTWFKGDFTKDKIFEDRYLIEAYCSYMSLDIIDYETFLESNPNKKILSSDKFIEYKNKFNSLSEIKNRCKQKTFTSLTNEQKELEMNNKFISYARDIEKHRLLFFMLAYANSQPVIIVKSPKTDIKNFLGYEWSTAKGNEGIKYIDVKNTEEDIINSIKGIDYIKTPLFNPKNLQDENKINSVIRKNYEGVNFDIPESIKEFVSSNNLIDMINFDSGSLEISTDIQDSAMKNKYKYPLEYIKDICEIKVGGDKPKIFSEEKTLELTVPVYSNGIENDGLYGYTDKASISEESVTVSARGTIGFAKLRTEPFFPIIRLIVAIPNKDKILPYYLCEILKLINISSTGSVQDQLTKPNFGKVKIPVPPIDIQNKIINDIKELDIEESKIINSINEYKNKIKELFVKLDSKNSNYKRLDESLVRINDYSINPNNNSNKEYIYIDIESVGKGNGKINYTKRILGSNAPSRARRLATSGSTVISTVRPYLKGFAYIDIELEDVVFSTGFAILKSANLDVLLDKWIYLSFMYSDNLMKQIEKVMNKSQYPSINNDNIRNLYIFVPNINKQEKIINTIETYFKEINNLESKLDNMASKKCKILNYYITK